MLHNSTCPFVLEMYGLRELGTNINGCRALSIRYYTQIQVKVGLNYFLP